MRNESSAGSRLYHPEAGVTNSSDPTIGVKEMKNLYIDRKSGNICSIPGYKRLYSFGKRIHSITAATHKDGTEYTYIHAGDGLYRFPSAEREGLKKLTPIAYLADSESSTLSLFDRIFIADGERLIAIDQNGEIRLLSEEERVAKCRAMAVCNGRLFLSVNQDLQSKILYSSPLSDHLPNSICEGEITLDNGAQITALLSGEDGLYVLTDRGITKWIHRENGYEIQSGIDGMNCTDGLFASGRMLVIGDIGLSVIENGEITTPCSYPIDRKSKFLGLWRGYAIILSGEKIILYDSLCKAGGFFPLVGLGSYVGDRRVYRYSSAEYEGYSNSKTPDEIATGEIISFEDRGGEMVYYEVDGKKKYRLYPTEEYIGGEFFGISAMMSDTENLWLGSEAGDLFILTEGTENYSFDRHAPEYLLTLHPDDCGLEGSAKDTLPRSLTLKLGEGSKGMVKITVTADGKEVYRRQHSAEMSVITANERATRWLEKQIKISAGGISSPISIRAVSFRFKTHQ